MQDGELGLVLRDFALDAPELVDKLVLLLLGRLVLVDLLEHPLHSGVLLDLSVLEALCSLTYSDVYFVLLDDQSQLLQLPVLLRRVFADVLVFVLEVLVLFLHLVHLLLLFFKLELAAVELLSRLVQLLRPFLQQPVQPVVFS